MKVYSGGGAGLPAATGGQTVFIGPTLPEEGRGRIIVQPEPDDEEQQDPLAYMLNTGLQPMISNATNAKCSNRGWCWRVKRIFKKSRSTRVRCRI